MNFEALGIATAFVGSWLVVIAFGFVALELTWKLVKRIVGIAKILKAIETNQDIKDKGGSA